MSEDEKTETAPQPKSWPLLASQMDLLHYLDRDYRTEVGRRGAAFKADLMKMAGYEDLPADAVLDLSIMAFRVR